MLRSAHGAGRSALVRVETCPPDELPRGLPEPMPEPCPGDRDTSGRFAAGNRSSAHGGRARGRVCKLARRLGVETGDAAWGELLDEARVFARATRRHLARSVGGGRVSPSVAAMIGSASIALASARWLLIAGPPDPDVSLKAARLNDSARQQLLTAHELASREAQRPGVAVTLPSVVAFLPPLDASVDDELDV